ncbi:MAG: hypothetical protein LBQ15_08355 [Clostridium sp.]|nr:hypothetical protein [Clostridium sp.]
MKILSGYVWEGEDKASAAEKENAAAEAWHSPEAVVLQQIRQGKEQLLFACVCEGKGENAVSGAFCSYLSEQLVEWFYQRGLHWYQLHDRLKPWHGSGSSWIRESTDTRMKRELKHRIGRILGELSDYSAKTGDRADVSMAGMLVAGKRFWLAQTGDARAYLINSRFQRPHIRRISDGDALPDSPRISQDVPAEISQDVSMESLKDVPAPAGTLTDVPAEVSVVSGRLQPGIGVLLCTQGFCSPLPETEISQSLAVPEITAESQLSRRLRELHRESRQRTRQGGGSAVYFILTAQQP